MRKSLIIILTCLIILGAGWYFYAKSHQSSPGIPSITDFRAFFPVGESGDPSILDNDSQNNPNTLNKTDSDFKRISASPVAGYSIFEQKSTITVPADVFVPKSKPTQETVIKQLLRYVSRQNGFVYEVEGEELPLQITNIYIPNIYEAYFVDNSETAILRFLRDDKRTIATYSVPIPPLNSDGTRTQKPGLYFPDNILSLDISPNKSQIARVINEKDEALLSLSSGINSKISTILKTPFKEWILSWPENKNIYLQTKPSSRVPGYLYKTDVSEKKLRRVLGDIDGLTTSVSPSGEYIIYSQYSSEGFVSRIFNTKTNSTRTLNLFLLPEKCAWLKNEDLICAGNSEIPSGQYPDDWYKGLMSFSDKLYRINPQNSIYETLYDNTGGDYDMTYLTVDETNNKIYFIDKKTGFLWQMKY